MREQFADLDAALTRLKLIYVPADAEPALTDSELNVCLTGSRTLDYENNKISDAAYTLTIDMAVAASTAWAIKANKAANSYTFSTDGQTFNKSDLIKHCKEQQKYWQSQQVSGLGTHYANYN